MNIKKYIIKFRLFYLRKIYEYTYNKINSLRGNI
jgi:hypothetical protein